MNILKLLLKIILIGPLSLGACAKDNPTDPVNEEPLGQPPATPSIIQVVPLAQKPNRGMHVIINDASDNEEGFSIERKIFGGTFAPLGNLPKNTETYDDWGVKMSTTYTYRIRAHNQFGNSNWSTEKTGTSAGPQKSITYIYPIADAYVSEGSPDINYGQSVNLNVILTESNEKGESYLKFPYEEIPSYATDIDSAELCLISRNVPHLYLYPPLVGVDDLAVDWYELEVTWNNRPFGRGIVWDLTYVYNNGQPVYWDVTPIVRDWFKGITLNHGIMLFQFDGVGQGAFYSRESNQKPVLSIGYFW